MQIKDESKTCYAQESFSWASTTKNSNLRAAIDRTVGKSLPEKVSPYFYIISFHLFSSHSSFSRFFIIFSLTLYPVKEDIFTSFQFYMKDENVSTCMKAKNVLLKTLQLVASANGDSEKTLKVESSENNHNSVDDQHWSGSIES